VEWTLFAANLAHVGLAWAVLALLLAALHLQERAASRYLAHRLGWRAVLVTGWLGVPLHELSHLVAARLFGHRIIAWKLFDPDPVSGTLGYVRHAYARRSSWQLAGQAVVAVAPVVGGALALAALLLWMVPAARLAELWNGHVATLAAVEPPAIADHWLQLGAALLAAGRELLAAIWQHRTPWLPLQIYAGVAVACHLAPSRGDFASAVVPALLLVGGSGLAALGGALAGVSLAPLVAMATLPLLALLPLVALFQGGYVAVVALIAWGQRRKGPRLRVAVR